MKQSMPIPWEFFFAFLMMQFFGGWTKPAYDVYKQQMTHMAPEIKTQWPVFG